MKPSLWALFFTSTFLLSAGCRDSDSEDDGPDAGDNTGGEVPLMECEQELTPPASGHCDVQSGSGSAVVIHGDILGDGVVYKNGTVMYQDDSIVCVGCDCASTPGFSEAATISCPDAAVSPGLINPHDHLGFTEGAPIPVSKRYDHRHEWRRELSTPGNPHGDGNESDGNRWGEMRMLMSGVTSMVGKKKANNLIRNLDGLDPQDESLGFQEVEFQTFSLGDSNSSSTNRPNCDWDYRNSESEVAELPAYLPHVAEGINEYAATEFKCQSSSFGNAEDITESNVTHIHSIGLSTTDYYHMARDQARILWSPRSNISLYGTTAQVQSFHRLGGTVALGTDWTYSGSANMIRELACADEYNRDYLDGYFSDEELFKMATINAAKSTASDELIGSLDTGKIADIAIYANSQNYYRAIFEAKNEDVALVIKAGTPLFGDENIMAGLGANCESLNLCGETKSICANEEFGKSYSAISGAVAGAYPAFFCGDPTSEPTCLPSRPGEYSGVASESDSDGDGIDNSSDNCPNVFNPIRPIDQGMQPDLDGDGEGDACDSSPLPDDLDMDGTANDADNCPFEANQDQADGDNDNKGDTCDFCPEQANPDSVCSVIVNVVPISDIQDGTISKGTRVAIEGAVVTAVYNRGFWAQDPAGGPFSGIHIFTSSDPGRSVGDRVNVQGEVAEFYDDTQLAFTTVTPMGSATPLEPEEVTVAQAASEDYEGVLVSLSDAATYVDPYDCSADNSSCMDDKLWEINGSIVVYDGAYEGSDWDDHTSQENVSGVLQFRHNSRRILPRSSADFAP